MTDLIKSIEYIITPIDRTGESWTGYEITTEKQMISVMIDNHQSCCEKFDVILLTAHDKDTDALIGANVQYVGWGSKVAPELKQTLVKHYKPDLDEYDIAHIVIDIETDRELIQCIAYNEHNGYYPHSVKVCWNNGMQEIQQI
jgi:hypothetical protein